MIRWILRFFGYEDQDAHIHSLVAQLQVDAPESSVMVRAKRALERHDRREQAIAQYKAETEEQVSKCKQERQEHQSTIMTSTQGLEQARKRVTARRERKDNPFLAAVQARKRAEG
jgi:hypothetical protein